MATTRRGSRNAKTVITADQYFFPSQAPDVVGLSRLEAIQALVDAGIDYLIVYSGNGATAENNDIVFDQVNDGISTIYVYEYTSSLLSITFLNGERDGNYSLTQDPNQLDGKVTGDVPTMSDVASGTVITIPGQGNLSQTEIELIFYNGSMTSNTVYPAFIGWTDGSGIYRENDSYTVNADTEFTALWASEVMAPGITDVTPNPSPAGTTVTITGVGLASVTQVKFNRNKIAQFTVLNNTTIQAVVPAGAIDGNIIVSTSGGGSGIFWFDFS